MTGTYLRVRVAHNRLRQATRVTKLPREDDSQQLSDRKTSHSVLLPVVDRLRVEE